MWLVGNILSSPSCDFLAITLCERTTAPPWAGEARNDKFKKIPGEFYGHRHELTFT